MADQEIKMEAYIVWMLRGEFYNNWRFALAYGYAKPKAHAAAGHNWNHDHNMVRNCL